jgi:hypothetical protein
MMVWAGGGKQASGLKGKGEERGLGVFLFFQSFQIVFKL